MRSDAMRLLVAVALLLGLSLPTSTASAQSSAAKLQPGDATVINKFISDLDRKQNGQTPDEDPRTILTGDLNHDGTPDVAVLFTIEGPGNGYAQFLAVFLRINGKLTPTDHVAVGGKLYRAAKMQSIQDGVIIFATTSYATHDPSCCPTIKATTHYTLVDNKLKETPQH
jgi:hypothetical protein